jgi:hypothetical protein
MTNIVEEQRIKSIQKMNQDELVESLPRLREEADKAAEALEDAQTTTVS